jgi:mono/diheme cytochrome c family protein
MYHGIIQHRFFLTTYLRKQSEDRGLDKVTHYGRIYRVLPEGKSPGPRPALSQASSGELLNTLAHRNGWWRDTAQRLLVERGDLSVVPALEKLAATAPEPGARLHALWTLEGLGALNIGTVSKVLDEAHPKVRAAGLRLAEAFLRTAPSNGLPSEVAGLRQKVLAMTRDSAAHVQVQLALTLGEIAQDAKTKELLAATAKESPIALVRDAATFSVVRHEPAKPKSTPAVAKARPLTADEQKRFQEGKAMYELTCLACHQQHGMGQEGLAPPLVDSEWVSGPPERLVRIVLHGMRGPITVKGQPFELDMPALGVLDDEQIAGALTYIRREWGHTYSPVGPELVKKVRAETAEREAGWTQAELLKIN